MRKNTYQPVTCVWELTMGCNMRCKHCGSSCDDPLPDELTTAEALDLCDQIADLGLKWVSLSGGEPTTRKDLPQIVCRLKQRGVAVNIITNGWLLDQQKAKDLKESGVSTVAISIDGTEKIHDSIRKPGSFAHSREAYHALHEAGIKAGAVTTVSKQNIDILKDLKEELISLGVSSWQLQIGLPMGNLKKRPDWVIDPAQMNDIINFCYDTAKEGRIKIFPADCIGYYTYKELETKKICYGTDQVSIWDGCNAGLRGFGILHNGDILGCTSIRSKEYVEGNIRKLSLRQIWEGESSFSWRRNMQKTQLDGLCKTCNYGSKCLGGCPNTRLTMKGSIYAENEYCAYHVEQKRLKEHYHTHTDGHALYRMALDKLQQKQYQEAAILLDRVTSLLPDHMEAFKAKGYCEYMCGNYDLCKEANEKALQQTPDDADALRGYAIAVYKLGNAAEGIRILRTAVEKTNWCNQDFLNDLYVMQNAMAAGKTI